MEFENILQFSGILENWINEANMSQLTQEKQVNLWTTARLNALSQYVLRISFSVFFWTTLPYSGGYHLERGGMPLHDAVGINCKNYPTTANQGTDIKYMD